MNKNSFSTLAVAVLLAGHSLPASAQLGFLQRCDKPMADAEQMARSVDECDASLQASYSALAKVDASTAGPAEKIVTSTTPLPVDLTRAAMTEPLHGRLVAYYSYSAFAAGDAAQCAVLGHLGSAQAALCRRNVADLGFVKARYGSAAELVSACRRTDEESGQPSPCCATLAEVRARPDPCGKLTPSCFDAPTCRAYFASSSGDARACRALPAPSAEDCRGEECPKLHAERVANCEGDALFAGAFKAKSAAACGGNQRCRALMGEGKAVAREIAAKDLKNPVGAWFLSSGWTKPNVVERSRAPRKAAAPSTVAPGKKIEFMGFVCAEPLTSVQNRSAAAAVVGVAQTCLKDVETALARPGRDVVEALDGRSEKLARLSLRLDRHFAPRRAEPVKK